jgi:hypothetical protein
MRFEGTGAWCCGSGTSCAPFPACARERRPDASACGSPYKERRALRGSGRRTGVGRSGSPARSRRSASWSRPERLSSEPTSQGLGLHSLDGLPLESPPRAARTEIDRDAQGAVGVGPHSARVGLLLPRSESSSAPAALGPTARRDHVHERTADASELGIVQGGLGGRQDDLLSGAGVQAPALRRCRDRGRRVAAEGVPCGSGVAPIQMTR